jgi:hypothetical protein
MTEAKMWTVDVYLTEDGPRTRADAVLRAGGDRELRGVGLARRHPDDTAVSEIGDEIATSRALSELAHRVLDVAAGDIQAVTGHRARVHP